MNIYRFAKRTAVAGLILLLLVTGFYLLGWQLYFLLLVFAGVLWAVLFSAMANWFSDKLHLKYGLGLLLAVILFFGVIIGAFWLIAPTVSEQFKQMSATVPQAAQQVKDWLGQYGWGSKILQKMPEDLSTSQLVSGDSISLFSGKGSILSKVTGLVSSTLSFLIDFLVVLVTAIFFAASPGIYKKGFTGLFPVRNQTRVLEVLDVLYQTLKTWLVAMLISMTMVGVTTAIGFKLIGIPMAYALAVLAFFFEFIPNIGPWLAGIPAVLIGLTMSTQTALVVAAVYFGIQLLESYVVTPLILKKAIELPPALLLFFQVFIGILGGALGLLLAAPLLAVLMVITRELWVKDVIKAKPLDAGKSKVGEEAGRPVVNEG